MQLKGASLMRLAQKHTAFLHAVLHRFESASVIHYLKSTWVVFMSCIFSSAKGKYKLNGIAPYYGQNILLFSY